ncbi:hypothetical protein WG29040_23120 [Pseudomonas sp. PAMC 29040]|uniref:hypothetical protein n=1 Tax=Pseudomonas sp. PAMC 29040 TaxID=2498450 RepID=UPI000FC13C2B|nr:hypothetical protein [Pseudomonas sp. PAMC 29040]RUT30833.1 hypothetical protein WG29040_23120 [Pseudomonas sp. PAMC 29040]
MADDTLNTDLLFRMIAHWVATKPNTYYGSTYGAPTEDLLQKPLSSPIADAYLAKMRQDIAVIGELPPGTINMYATHDGLDRKTIFIEINGSSVSLADLGDVNRGSY